MGMRALLVVAGAMMALSANAAETEIKTLNRGADGMMVFEPAFVHIALGDTVHFLASDKGHNVESIPGMIPDGADAISGKISEDVTVKFDKPGVYGIRCKPHYGMGMVALVVVGTPTNEDAAKAVVNPGKAKDRFAKLFAELDAEKPTGK